MFWDIIIHISTFEIMTQAQQMVPYKFKNIVQAKVNKTKQLSCLTNLTIIMTVSAPKSLDDLCDFTELRELNVCIQNEQKHNIIPCNINALSMLTNFVWKINYLSAFPQLNSSISQLSLMMKIVDVDLSGTTINDNEFDQLCNLYLLKTLTLSNCLIRNVPEKIGHLRSLKKLNLSRNWLTTDNLNSALYGLPQLTYLNLSQCRIGKIPLCIGNMSFLEHFDFSVNYPNCVSNNSYTILNNLANLTYLDIGANQFDDFMGAGLKCSKLEYLDIGYCKLKIIYPFIAQFTSLKMFRFEGNPIEIFPCNYFLRVPEFKHLTLVGKIPYYSAQYDELTRYVEKYENLSY